MRVAKRPPSLRRTVWACVLASLAVGLPVALWHGVTEATDGPVRKPGVFVEVLFFVLALAGLVGGILGCCVHIARPAWWWARR